MLLEAIGHEMVSNCNICRNITRWIKRSICFTQPTFETEIQCQADITDPAVVPILVQQVIKDNGYRPIEKVICMEENDFIELYKKSWQEENEISL